MKPTSFRSLIWLTLAVFLLITACRQTSNDSAPALAPTVDIDEIAATVVAEIEANLSSSEEPNGFVKEEDSAAELAAILKQVETYLAEREEQAPVALIEEDPEEEEPDFETTLIDLYRRTNPAVVYIIVPPVGSGSGFVYSDEGYIVTNNHVVELGQEYEVVFATGERLSADLVGRDVDSDLAVIKVGQLPDGVSALALSPSADLEVGQFVIAIGNPFGEQGSMSLGIISGLDRSLSSQRDTITGNSYSLPEVIQTDAPINPGNSGGPLLNIDGEVVGVNSAIVSATGTNSGVGFSIPSDALMRIVPSLIESGFYEYPYMGASFDGEISLRDLADFDIAQTQGAYVITVTEGGPSDVAGLVPADPNTGRGGDLIIDIDGVPINDFSDLNSYLVFNTVAGQTIDITVLRDDGEVVILLILGTRPEN